MRLSRLLLITALTATMTGCSTVQGWFNSEGEDLTAPVELEPIDALVKAKKRWSTSVGDGQGKGFFKIRPAL